MRETGKLRLAVIVSHPIQYYVPLYRRLAKREDLEIKVFFTWHGAERPVEDYGFKKNIAWDISLTDGYSFHVVPNVARNPGTHHFWGLRNPKLIDTVLTWKPDAIVLTGYAYASHLNAIHSFHSRNLPVFFRGDSHLLNQRYGLGWALKRALLRRVYAWTAACLFVGAHNRSYYRAFGVPDEKLFFCPHSIEVDRFAQPHEELEQKAAVWRKQLSIGDDRLLLLFAGKFEKKKQPVSLMKAVNRYPDPRVMLVLVGDGELSDEIRRIERSAPDRFRLLPFQNQSQMPLVYRLGDIFVLPSAYGETWGLAVNEAIACGRPVLVSDSVGCAPELVLKGQTGEIFRTNDWIDFHEKLENSISFAKKVNRSTFLRFARQFDISETEKHLIFALTTATRGLHCEKAVTPA